MGHHEKLRLVKATDVMSLPQTAAHFPNNFGEIVGAVWIPVVCLLSIVDWLTLSIDFVGWIR